MSLPKYDLATRVYLVVLFSALSAAILYISLPFPGPTYLSDEVGYLTNAAFLTGSRVDQASSYHFGYSALYAIAFVAFDSINVIWRYVQILNAILTLLTIYVLYVISYKIFPNLSSHQRLLSLTVCALYPTILVQSSYGFPLPAISFVYILSVYFLLKASRSDPSYLIFHSILVGSLYLIHPSGIAAAAVTAVILVVVGIRERLYSYVTVSFLAMLTIVVGYHSFIHPTLAKMMTIGSQPANLHYPNITTLLSSLTPPQIGEVIVRSLGQLSYLTIATTGFALLGLWQCTTAVFQRRNADTFYFAPWLFMGLAPLSVIGVGAIMFSFVLADRTDHWFYGRYVDGFMLPLFLVGLCAPRRWPVAGLAFVLPILTAALVALMDSPARMSLINGWWGFNAVNTMSFWPLLVHQQVTLLYGITIGAAVSAVALMLPRYLSYALLTGLFVATYPLQMSWHSTVWQGHSHPSSFPEAIRRQWPEGSCVAIDSSLPDGRDADRAKLYALHLRDYEVRRMTPDEWKAECDGPYITDRAVTTPDTITLVREGESNLVALAKGGTVPNFAASDFSDLYVAGAPCMTAALCRSAGDLMSHSQVGQLSNGTLRSTGKTGALFYGPYIAMPKGQYTAEVHLNVSDAGNMILDVYSHSRRQSFASQSSFAIGDNTIIMPFTLDEAIPDMEIRLFVSNQSAVSVRDYVVRQVSN